MFNGNDKKNLENLMSMIANNIKMHDLDCMDISKIYHAFQWLQGLDGKIDSAMAMQIDIENMEDIIDRREKELLVHIESLEGEIKELQKPKRKPRTKKSK